MLPVSPGPVQFSSGGLGGLPGAGSVVLGGNRLGMCIADLTAGLANDPVPVLFDSEGIPEGRILTAL